MKETIKSWYLKLVQPDTPLIIRKAAKWTLVFFLAVTALLTIKMLFDTASLFAAFWTLIGFALFAFVAAGSVFLAYRVLTVASGKTNFIKLDAMFRERGYTPEMGSLVKNSNPFGSPREMLIAAFLFLMAEDYEKAKTMFHAVSTAEMTQRCRALYELCRMQYQAMNGKLESAERLFEEQRAFLDREYETEPELTGTYRPYLDDAMVYYTLAGALSARAGDRDAVLRYRGEAEFQSGKREIFSERELLMELFDLNVLFAKGDLKAGDAKLISLRQEIADASVIPQGRQDDLLRMSLQAPIYANLKSAVGKDVRRERPLPQQAETTLTPDKMGLIDF